MKDTLRQQPVLRDDFEKARKKCKRKFLYYFPKGYQGEKFMQWERKYKLDAHQRFQNLYNKASYQELLKQEEYEKIAFGIANIESKTNLLFSFEKMALRDAIKSYEGAKAFSTGLYHYLYDEEILEQRFQKFIAVIGALPRKQTRVLTWPLVTVFGFIALPSEHLFLKPRVTQAAAAKYKYDFQYKSSPNWRTYANLLRFAKQVKADTKDLGPRDNIDIQSFIWVLGSAEYPD